MRKETHLLLLIGTLLSSMQVAAQGCSDAGVCTAGPIGELVAPNDTSSTTPEKRHFARMTFSYAVGEQQTTILMAVAELGFGITDRLGMSLRLPYQSTEGNLGSNSGVGDPVITASYAFIKQEGRRLDAMVGVKLNSGNADDTWDGFSIDQVPRSRPMPYQTSLGTTDLLLGVNYRHKRWSGALALQLPVHQANENTFTHASWGQDPAALGYFESAYLERAPDAVARVQYRFSWGRFALQPGLLAIQHLGKDSRLAAVPTMDMMMPQRVEIDGSEGLTLNLTLDAGYRLGDRWTVELAYGSPMIVREERPDGLTRSMVLNAGLRYAF
ncbi:MAG: hypothetical protein ACK6A5_17975 [Flavobacteriales bacterium]